ncbi:MAG: SpoIID/LytB domain-containing protein [candidate division KSB1 bacterium]|nr:SpoIID/LytB domain-containing protein [candidate division KSB1 bacterium]MDZ7301760.1 SpoIID/LytB domain-containing protein [candidate division KSB1 bacterium]MDZ7311461.1 SpoIID/LytB domain-containing protein [candidate division KSB1 bacterium]
MLNREPAISVGIYEGRPVASGVLHGTFVINGQNAGQGEFRIEAVANELVMIAGNGKEMARGTEISCLPIAGATFTLCDVTIGVHFHWQRKEDQTFEGRLRFLRREDGSITAINEIPVEAYLKSVISSEMSAAAPIELLKAHAITSRSWLVAMLERQKKFKNIALPSRRSRETTDEIIRWYDREDHKDFDVCADDHCQRYQGISKIISPAAAQAVEETRGLFLTHHDEICDARFSKSCGGLSEAFENAWEDTPVPYLKTISDSHIQHPPITGESQAEKWILSSPEAYCNTREANILRQILPAFDQETTDFFRWTVQYRREELEDILATKSEMNFGTLLDLVPVQRGTSGRIVKLKIIGAEKSIVVGKELEIRRWLSRSHLYSSAFIIRSERNEQGIPLRFTLHGAGWGHGVGLCQIGAAVMATRGFKAEEIVKHYFRAAKLKKLY